MILLNIGKYSMPTCQFLRIITFFALCWVAQEGTTSKLPILEPSLRFGKDSLVWDVLTSGMLYLPNLLVVKILKRLNAALVYILQTFFSLCFRNCLFYHKTIECCCLWHTIQPFLLLLVLLSGNCLFALAHQSVASRYSPPPDTWGREAHQVREPDKKWFSQRGLDWNPYTSSYSR